MEPYRDDDLTAALSALRPAPRPAFAAELDARVAAGFPRKSRFGALSPRRVADRVRALKPRQVLLPVGAAAVTAIVIATAISLSAPGQGEQQISLHSAKSRISAPRQEPAPVNDAGAPAQTTGQSSGSSTRGGGSIGSVYETEVPSTPAAAGAASQANPEGAEALSADATSNRNAGFAAGRQHRAVERSAEITLGTEPAKVGDAAAEVFDVVHAYRGIVLSSSTSDGSAGEASAEFELLIPSAKLGDAMAAFSGIAEVRSRHEATTDITAPTVGLAEHLQDSQARIDGLLAQLAEADTEGEREAVEAELRSERSRAAALRASLQNLERRANLSRVALRIESGEAGAAPGAGGSWGIRDALDDAGHILAVAAAVTLVGLAILGPLALIALLAWLAHRAWLRRARRQALG